MDSDWASLPVNLLDSISEKMISTRDYLRFGAVCSSWHSVAKYNAKKRNNLVSHEVPMLMIPSEDEHLHDVYDVTNERFLKSKLVAPFNKRFSGSSLGWFVTANSDFSVTLYKPCFTVSGNISSKVKSIALPCLEQFRDPADFENVSEYGVRKAVISADPLKNPEKSILMVKCGFSYRLAYIRPSKDTTWSYLDDSPTIKYDCDDIIYYNDQFYALNCDGRLISFEATEEPFNLNPKLTATLCPPDTITGTRYLVELNGKLLHVERRRAGVLYDDITIAVTTRFLLYELDLDEKSWKKTEQRIGDYALFLGDNSSFSVLASNFAGCKSNSIYFSDDQDGSITNFITDYGVYNIHSGTVDLNFNMAVDLKFNTPVDDNLTKPNRVPIWIEPYSINES